MKLRALLLLLPLTAAVQAQQPAQPPAVRSPEVAAGSAASPSAFARQTRQR